jgi:hypothetical protein
MCGGELEVIPDRDLGDCMRFRAIRDAVQFELNSYHFFRLARERATTPDQRIVLERFYEAGLEHLYELEEKYHAHLEREMVEFAAVIGFETEEDAKKAAPLINWDASLCRAIVYLQGPAKLMPWTSSKSGINAGHPVFQRLRPTLIELLSHFTKLSRRLKNDWDEKVTPHATGRIEVITAADIAPGKRLNLPTLPRGNKQQVEHLKAQNKTVLKDAPWTLGLIEAIAAVDVIKRQRLDTKNRIHLGRADGPQLSPTIMVPD